MFRNKENQYSNFLFAHFSIPTIRIPNIVCVQNRDCACSDFLFLIFGILKILCPIFFIKEHHISDISDSEISMFMFYFHCSYYFCISYSSTNFMPILNFLCVIFCRSPYKFGRNLVSKLGLKHRKGVRIN